jgi:drug/metabolite transporter (DMT)-like permease
VAAAFSEPRALGHTAVGAFFGPFLGVSLSLFAVQRIDTGVAASLMAMTPILILPVLALTGRERIGPGGVLGAVVAVAGVALLFR